MTMKATDDSLIPEAVALAISEILNEAQAKWASDIELLRAEHKARIAEMERDYLQFKIDLITTKAGE